MKVSKVGAVSAPSTWRPTVRADLDTLLIAVYCAACALFPADRRPQRGRPEKITDNELITLMVAQMLLGRASERGFLPLAGWRLRHLFPHLPAQSTYNERCRGLAPKLVVLWRAIADELPGGNDTIALLDTTPASMRTEHHGRQPQRARALVRFRLERGTLALLLGHAPRPALRPGRDDPRLRPRPRERARA
jgi:hypothetical protein